MFSIFLVSIGGACGSTCRYLITLFLKNYNFPWAVAIVNIVGSFAIGLLSALCLQRFQCIDGVLRPLLIVGFLGGFTTFSSFSMDSLRLIMSEEYFQLCFNIFLNIFAGIIMAGVGYRLGSYWGSL